MRRLIAIITAAALLGGVMPLGEMVKLPHLIEHFLEHAQGGTSFGDYIEFHYAHTPESHEDEHHDKGCLPFQGGDRGASTLSLGSMDRPESGMTGAVDMSAPATRIALAAAEDLPSATLGSIFQPPRMG